MAKKNNKKTKPVEEVVTELEEKVMEPVEEQINEKEIIEEIIPEVNDEEELLNEFTSPENIENLEKELDEEYANTKNNEEETPEDTVDLGIAQEVIEKFGDASERLNRIVNNTKTEDLEKTLQEELNQASEIEKKLQKRIDELENKIPPQTRSNLNARMTNLWCGVRYT